jgi:xanthine dehydrogenase YagS FAD-binding subunit
VRPFAYERATDAREAIAIVEASEQTTFLAGGTNLVDLMRLGVATPDALIDVRGVTSDRIEELPDGGIRIGAAVRNSDLAADRRIRRRYPVLARALLSGASGQLRNQATVGGNLLQRTRCAYFQDLTTPCNKREPGAGCSALAGLGRDAAILGASASCAATHPSDMAVALTALDAIVQTRTSSGGRSIALTDLHRLPGRRPDRDTVLDHGELITHVDLAPLPFAANSGYWKVRDRASYAFALVSLAAALDMADGTVRDVRLALGGVAHKPWRAGTAERALRGGPATAEAFRSAAEAELADAQPLADNGFKIPLAINMITEFLVALAGGDR